jgi:hypothetical protein
MRMDSLRNESSLYIFIIVALVQPSFETRGSISSRSGLTYSGWAARSNNALVKVYDQNVN